MSLNSEVRFCLRCGASVELRERYGATRPVCPACDYVHFHEPKVAAAVLLIENGRVLLVRRVMEPERGKWSLPAGFVDGDEDPRRTAVRECLEETGLTVELTALLDVLHSQEHGRGASIIIVYEGHVRSGTLLAQDDVDDAAWFDLGALPPLAFATTKLILQRQYPMSL